ncbi:hypothetical protein EHQ58_07955 [Leptospira ognonensis]|uniref:Uncharacterized protein n=1 Tax=Leptospira ognonensis TaxID=2484945 RepID=A0A4R9K400_9LEPT|nr:hypothetical protein [Leptospira ognonensis]TGL59670.1 hypothetical protein EHQ58_07955 [Leptospira ognonensis]
MNHPILYLEYLKEKRTIKRLTLLRKSISYTFLLVFFYFLFSVSYTASPSIVILNYLALYTSVSGLIFLKVFEIPRCIQDVLKERDDAKIFQLTEHYRSEILDSLARNLNLFDSKVDYGKLQAEGIIGLFRLDQRLPWSKIGLAYLIVYLFTVLFLCTYLTLDFLETGFSRP